MLVGAPIDILGGVDRRHAIAQLPGSLGFALFLREAGLSDGEIAIRMRLDPAAAATLLAQAEQQVAAMMPGATEPTPPEAESP